jgi:hypothetical protein
MVELQVMSGYAHLHPTGVCKSEMKAKAVKQSSDKWCEHHEMLGHDTKETHMKNGLQTCKKEEAMLRKEGENEHS